MDYTRLNFEESFLSESSAYTSWSKTAPKPEVSTGPSEVTYSAATLITSNYKYRPLEALSDAEIKTIGVTAIKALEDKKVSEAVLVQICRLALSLKASNGEKVFVAPSVSFASKEETTPKSDTFVPSPADTRGATDYLSVATGKSSSSASQSKKTVSTLASEDPNYATSIPYIMSSFIRLIVKPATAWSNAIGAIKTQYGVFYGTTSKFVTGFPADPDMAVVVKNAFDTFKPIVNYLAYVAGVTDKAQNSNSKEHGMFVYFMGQHLSFSGMHAYPMTIELMLKCKGISPALFLTFLDVEETTEAVKEIHRIATTYDAPSSTARGSRDFLWKYARIIDEGFFLKLQNKKNKEFLFSLAILHEKMGLISNNQYAKPTNMMILKNQEGLRADAEEFANLFIFLYKKAVGQGEGAAPISKLRAQMAGDRVSAAIAAASTPKRKAPQEPNNTKKSKSDDMDVDSIKF
ncbi:N [Cereal chlorotic mottle virus]|uniref:Nucleoprotein n=1 Tax=Cereal chlorotic mottle virus TaxID=2964312 RepID=A0A976RX47_9RHAB|nr:N [Cereal chlorotic mottle virus] [Cereal chlorotic mottle virus]